MLFGVSCVGKSTVGKIMAEMLGYQYFDLDDEIKKFYNCTLEEFVNGPYNRYERDEKRLMLMDYLLKLDGDKVFAITPLSHHKYVDHLLSYEDVIAVELSDTYLNIYDRLVFSDENDNIYQGDEYKELHRDHYLEDIIEDRLFYGEAFKNAPNVMNVNNRLPEDVAKDIIDTYI